MRNIYIRPRVISSLTVLLSKYTAALLRTSYTYLIFTFLLLFSCIAYTVLLILLMWGPHPAGFLIRPLGYNDKDKPLTLNGPLALFQQIYVCDGEIMIKEGSFFLLVGPHQK